MKTFAAILLIFTLLLGFSVFAYYYIDNTARSMISSTDSIIKSAGAGDWRQAEKRFGQLQASWDKTHFKWTVLLDHQELDNINISLSRTREFMKTRNTSGFMAEIAELRLLFKHIPEKEALNLENIL